MQCRTHPTHTANTTCNQCGSWLCDSCVVSHAGRQFCHACFALNSAEGQAQNFNSTPPPVAPMYGPPRYGSNRLNKGLLLFFSLFFPPGTNYMYMGLMRRGLATMAGFFFIIFLIINSSSWVVVLLGLSIPVLVITSIFDGFNVCRRINSGEIVKDDVGEIVRGILGNKFLCTLIMATISIVIIVNVLGFAFNVISALLPLVAIGIGVYVVFKAFKKK